MGKGDKKTKKGKIWKGTYGNARKHKVRKANAYVPESPAEQATSGSSLATPPKKKTVRKVAKPKADTPAKKVSTSAKAKPAKKVAAAAKKAKPTTARKTVVKKKVSD